jgi:hypothetical protein
VLGFDETTEKVRLAMEAHVSPRLIVLDRVFEVLRTAAFRSALS